MRTQTRIVLAGISGIRKTAIAENFRKTLAEQQGLHGDAAIDAKIKIVESELLIKKDPQFLNGLITNQMQLLRGSYNGALARLRSPPVKAANTVLIPLHFTFISYDRAFTPLAWPVSVDGGPAPSLLLDYLEQIKPTAIINLIDDIHFIQEQVLRGNAKIELRLRELIKWREFETSVVDFAANHIIRRKPPHNTFIDDRFERSPVFAVQHPKMCLFRYLFEPETPRVYTSFPISRARRSPDKDFRESFTEQINDFTSALSEHFATFNPLTIDEVPLNLFYDELLESYGEEKQMPKTVSFPMDRRWPLPGNDKLSSATPLKIDEMQVSDLSDVSQVLDEKGHVVTDPEEKKMGRTIIGRQVVGRDLRLIGQSDCIAIYRPTSPPNKNWSRGVRHEYLTALQYASERAFMKTYIVRDKNHDGPLWGDVPGQTGQTKTFEDESVNATVIENFGNLDNAANRKNALQELVDKIKADAPRLTARRSA